MKIRKRKNIISFKSDKKDFIKQKFHYLESFMDRNNNKKKVHYVNLVVKLDLVIFIIHQLHNDDDDDVR